jgi:TolB protein
MTVSGEFKMMNNFRWLGWGRFLAAVITAVVCSWAHGPSHAQYEYLDISKPFLRKIPLAIPSFKIATQDPEVAKQGQMAVDVLSASLDFTGFFQLLDPEAFLFDPQKGGIKGTDINFSNWTVIGAELLITGSYQLEDGRVQMELRLFDTFKGRRVLGKRYTGGIEDQRQMILRFCSEVISFLTGNKGIFGSKLAFISDGSGNKEIYTCDFDGQNPKRLTYNNAITLFPDWSSTGNYLAYTSYKSKKPDLFIRNLKSNDEVTIAREGNNITPAWVPGKFSLAATLSFEGDPEIYMLTGAGKIIKRLTRKRGIDVSPSWSPDGQRFVFVSNRSGSPQLYIKNLQSGSVRRLTYQGNYNTQPTWSPRGDKIAYSSQVEGWHQIFVVGLDGLEPIQLTFDVADNEAPSWSPDGSLIIFSSTREGPSRLYVMTAFGTDQRRLLALPGQQTNPKWSTNLINN